MDSDSKQQGEFIWLAGEPRGRVVTGLFRHAFELEGEVEGGVLHLFADTRYRLEVNGEVVCHGPARFKKGWPLFDTIDLKSYLRSGTNVIAVTVSSFPYGTFLSDPGPGCLVAWGKARAAGGHCSLASGAHWKALMSPAHDAEMPDLSFAVGPGESLDGRRIPKEWQEADFDDGDWPRAEVIDGSPWGELQPRSIPMLDESEEEPPSLVDVFGLAKGNSEKVYSGNLYDAGGKRGVMGLRGFVHCGEARTIRMRLSQGSLLANRQETEGEREDGYVEIALQQGWNELLVYNRTRRSVWEFALAVPEDDGLALRRRPETDAAEGLDWAPVVEQGFDEFGLRKEIVLTDLLEALDEAGWLACESVEVGGAQPPMVERQWDRLEPVAQSGEAFRVVLEKGIRRGYEGGKSGAGEVSEAPAGHVFLFDFGQEVLGRPEIELTAPEGLVVDLTYTERIEKGQAVPWYQGTRMAERYVCRDGRQMWRLLQPRGLRYMELIVRGPLEGVRLHDVGMRRALYPGKDAGSFRCSDDRLNQIWQMCRRTQRVCMEDAYLDCPWRERGLYIADLLVQYHNNLALLGDHALMRRSLQLIFQSIGENDLLPPCPHGLPPGKLPDFSAIAITAVRHYWDMTGDVELVEELREPMLRVLEGLRRLREEHPWLLGFEGARPYIDNGMVEKQGVSAGLNLIAQRAFHDAAVLLSQLKGSEEQAEALKEEAAEMAKALVELFRERDSGLFCDQKLNTDKENHHSVAVNTLAALCGHASGDSLAAILDWLEGALRDNFCGQEPTHRRNIRVSPMFSFYTIDLLYRHGRAEAALDFMRTYWGYMLDRGAWTCWEFFAPVCSLCHAWSASPLRHLSVWALGLRPAGDGSPSLPLVFDPRPGGLDWAEGAYPHPNGPVRTRWERDGERIRYWLTVPEGVEVRVAEREDLVAGDGMRK